MTKVEPLPESKRLKEARFALETANENLLEHSQTLPPGVYRGRFSAVIELLDAAQKIVTNLATNTYWEYCAECDVETRTSPQGECYMCGSSAPVLD